MNDITLSSAMMMELQTRKREIGDEDENTVEDTREYVKSGV